MAVASRTFRVFISSTFNDLKRERNALQEHVFPRLQALCEAHGARFQAIDLRWGVSQEAALDQQAVPICLREIERCRAATPRPNFVVLLGDRYGWRPLPAEIPAADLERIRETISDSTGRVLLDEWYGRWLDANARPPVHRLQPRTGEMVDEARWAVVERRLRDVLAGAGFGWSAGVRGVGASATELEIEQGAFGPGDAREHVFAFVRRILDLPPEPAPSPYLDFLASGSVDREAGARLTELIERLEEHLGPNVHTYQARWSGDDEAEPITLDHLRPLCEDVYRRLEAVILREFERLEVRGAVELEAEAHRLFGRRLSGSFLGRTTELAQIATYLGEPTGGPLVVRGPSGSGKSALLSKAVEQAARAHPEASIVTRFVGVTPGASGESTLLEGICLEIDALPGLARDPAGASGEFDQEDLFRSLRQRLERARPERPLFVFLDALDQLRGGDAARRVGRLAAELPPHARLVLSSVPDEACDALCARLGAEGRLELGPLPAGDCRKLLDLWLADAERGLTPEQSAAVRESFQRSGLPLYMRLVFEEARRWRSYDGVPAIPPTIEAMFAALFERLAASHGDLLVARCLGWLAAARHGLSEGELLGLLASDDDFFAHFVEHAHHALPESATRRIPVAIWARLFADLEPYLAEREADGTTLLGFYHRQIQEAAAHAYLSGPDEGARRSRFATYFAVQPLQLGAGARAPNLRKLSELPFQQAAAGLWDDLEQTLTSLEFLDTKVRAVGPQPLVDDCAESARCGCPETLIPILGDLFRLASHALGRDPGQLRGQLVGRLTGDEHPRLRGLLQQVGADERPWIRPPAGSLGTVGGPLVRTLAGGAVSPGTVGGALVRTLAEGAVSSLALTPCGRMAVSAAGRATLDVWDLASGIRLRELRGHADRVLTVRVTPDGRRVLSGSADRTVRLWDLETGVLLHTWAGHADSVHVVVPTPDGRRAVSVLGGPWGFGQQDTTLRVLDLESGDELRAIDSGGVPRQWNTEGRACKLMGVRVVPDGRRAVSASTEGRIQFWDLETGEELRTLGTHMECVESIELTPDGRVAVTASKKDGTLRVWDLEEGGERLRDVKAGGERLRMACADVVALRVTPDGRRVIALSGSDGFLRTWDLATGARVGEARAGPDQTVLALSPDGSRAVAGCASGALTVWDLSSGASTFLIGHRGPVLAVEVTPDGRQVVSGSADGTIRLWKIDQGSRARPSLPNRAPFRSLALTSREARAVAGSDDGILEVWDLADGSRRHAVRADPRELRALALTPDERHVVTAGGTGVNVWDLATGKALHHLPGHRDGTWDVAVTPDGRRALATGQDRTMSVWDLESGELLFRLEGHEEPVRVVAVTPDGRRAISAAQGTLRDILRGSGAPSAGPWKVVSTPAGPRKVFMHEDHHLEKPVGMLRVWDLESGAALRSLVGHTGTVTALASLPRGRAVSASNDGTLRVWELESGETLHVLAGHARRVGRLVVIGEGHQALSGSDDGTIRKWDLDSGRELALFRAGGVTGLAVTPDGALAVSCSADRTLRVWDLVADAALASFDTEGGLTACALAEDGRTLVACDITGGIRFLRLEGTLGVEPQETGA